MKNIETYPIFIEENPKSRCLVWTGVGLSNWPHETTKSLEGFVGQANLEALHRSNEDLHMEQQPEGTWSPSSHMAMGNLA